MPATDAISADLLAINLVGCSRTLLDVIATVRRVASFDVVVSIYGETGTGKELIARSLHYSGSRCSGPFIPVNCGALPDNLFESELFGHEKGAFTDAQHEHPGLIEQANGGTLFLDEIEALSAKGQAALLRFLQDRQYRRVGGVRFRTADVRIVVASNVPLEKLLTCGEQFRQDLFYRLTVLPIRVPPLRERPEDVPLLAHHFLTIYKARFSAPGKYLASESVAWLLRRNWPGNVRELENAIQRGVLLAPGDEIFPEHMVPQILAGSGSPEPMNTDLDDIAFSNAKQQMIERFEREYLQSMLLRSAGNVTLAARYAHKDRRAFGKLLKKHGIRPGDFHSS